MPTIKHKNSGEVIDEFPKYGQSDFAQYGYFVITDDKRVLHFYVDGNDSVAYDDVSDSFEWIE